MTFHGYSIGRVHCNTDTPNNCTDTPGAKTQQLVSEEHVPIRLRVYWYPMHQNNIYEGKSAPTAPKHPQQSPPARRSFDTIKDTSKHP
ncbi:hypothetical protein GQ457_04G020900 [Hibiscus cannabinus]